MKKTQSFQGEIQVRISTPTPRRQGTVPSDVGWVGERGKPRNVRLSGERKGKKKQHSTNNQTLSLGLFPS